jgi:hypothetical protein
MNAFYKTIKEEYMPNLFKHLKKKLKSRKPIYEVNSTLIPKSGKYFTRKESCMLISLINTDENVIDKILANQIQ